MELLLELLLLLLLCVLPLQSFSSGLVVDSCEDMRPRHSGVSPQTEASPFTVEYRRGQEVTVQLQAPASRPFVGFLLQAREVGSSAPIGSFTVTSGSSQLLRCSNKPNSAVSHRSGSRKSSVEVTWTPEPGDTKAIQFHATFVQNYTMFWLDVTSPVLTVSDTTDDPSVPRTSSTSLTSSASSTSAPPATLPQISASDCGLLKVCLSEPLDCDPALSAQCYFMSVMMFPAGGPMLRYELTGPSVGYVSLGFSDDLIMGNDDIYICVRGKEGLIEVQHAVSVGRTAPRILPLVNVSDVKASEQDGIISCSFTSMNLISTQRSAGLNRSYYLMFAHGPSQNGQIQFHKSTFISADKVDVSQPAQVQTAGRPNIIKAHGALMLMAWMSSGPVGMMVARYLRAVASEQRLCGKNVWFVVHIMLMSVTVAATIVAFILPFSHVKAWSGGAHPVLGCLLLVSSSLQAGLALLRPGPQRPLRSLFNWSHSLMAVLIKVLSVASVFTGLKLIDSSADQWLMKVMGGCVSWEALCFILLELHVIWNKSSGGTAAPLTSRRTRLNIVLMSVFFGGNLPFVVALLVGIGTL